MELLRSDVRWFLHGAKATVPDLYWDTVFTSHRVDYTGELVVKARPLEWARVEAALPPPGMAGRVNALTLCSLSLRPWLESPERCLRDRSEWPEQLAKARVLVKDGEWNQLLEGFCRRNVVTFITEEQAVWHRGQRLGSRLFGVPKGELSSDGFDPKMATQRLIVNAIPSNELQHTLVGAIKDLPLFTQWIGAELLEDEAILWSAEGQSSSFYLYALPAAWWPYFALPRLREHENKGGAPDATVP